MPLDFTRAMALFTGTEQELAMALDIGVGDVRQYRANPQRVPPDVTAKLGRVLLERGQGMARVGEMLIEQAGAARERDGGS
jgi:hypothetical protein